MSVLKLARLGTAVVALVGMGLPARASVGGTPPALLQTFQVQGSGNTTGATLMAHDGFGVNIALLPDSTANLTNVPTDAVVAGAWLFWSGSESMFAGVDNSIRFLTPGGGNYINLRTDQCQPGESPCNLSLNRCVETQTPTIPTTFFYCRRDVTGLLNRIPSNQVGGQYTVGDVTADPGITSGGPGQCAPEDPSCQAKYAGWSMVVVWQSPSAVVIRDAVLWDGFLFADEDFGIPGGGSGVANPFTMTGFSAKANARAELSYFALEGDSQLGVPPQNVPGNQLFCPTCFDRMSISTPSHPTPWFVTDGTMLNPPGNLFNSSNKNGGDSIGVDVDSFNVGFGSTERVVNGGDTSLSVVLASGDGQPGGDSGGGELFFMGYLFLALDTDAPRLANVGTFKSASLTTAAPGDTIAYTIRITNDGAANATNVRVADSLPTGTTYVAGSTTTSCGVSGADVGGTSPLFQPTGLNLGTIRFDGATRFCEVRFQVRINNNTMSGTVTNTALIGADSLMTFPVTATTTVVAPTLSRFEKTVSGATGGGALPGTTLTYTLTVFGNATMNVNGVSVVDQLPAELQGVAVLSRPMGSTLVSDVTTGRLQVDNINVAAGGSAVITFTATIRANTADAVAIRNQGSLTFPGGGPLLSNDPSTPAAADPTVVTVFNRIDLSTSSKAVVSPAMLNARPGDTLRWRIHATNSGNRTATVAVLDDLPANVSTCAIVTAPAGVACAPGGANGTGRVSGNITLAAGASADVEFTALLLASAPDGLVLINRATLTPAEDPTRAVTLTAAGIIVVNRPVLTTSTKTFVDVNGGTARPGDVIRYTLVVTNSGTRAATNVVVNDPLDANLTVVTVGNGGTAAAGVVTWNAAGNAALASLAPMGSVTLTLDVRINAGVANGTVISNVGRIGSTEVTPAISTAPATFTVTSAPVLVATKTVTDTNGPPFRPGDTVRYTLTVSNTGDGTATNVSIVDPLDASLTFVSASNGGASAAGSVTWSLPSLAPGAANAVTLTLDALINTPLDNATVVSNQARLTSTELSTPSLSDDPVAPGAADPTRFSVTSAPVLTLQKTVTDLNGGDTLPGEDVRYTLTLTNTGNAVARNVTVTDVVDARLTAVTPETGGTLAGSTVTWTQAALNPATPLVLTFRARVVFPLANGTTIPNQANALSGGLSVTSDDPATPAMNDPTVLLVQSRPVVLMTKRVSNVTTGGLLYHPGDQVAYDITLRNTGSENALNAIITDVLDARLTSINVGAGGTLTGQTARYDRNTLPTLASVAPNTSVSVRITATIVLPLDNGTTLSNVANGSADTVTPVASDNPDTPTANDPTVITITSAPVLASQKTVLDLNGGAFAPGDAVRYSINVTNSGTANARNVVITDTLDANLRNVVPSAGGAVSAGAIRWDGTGVAGLVAMAPGQTVTVTFDASIATPLDDGTLVNNQARIAADGQPALFSDDPNTPAEADPTSIRVTSAADLSNSTKEILNAAGTRITQATPGVPIRYRITVQNRGNAVARNVDVDDALPAEFAATTVTNGQLSGQNVTASFTQFPALAALAPGQTFVVDIAGALRIPLDDGLVVGNQARLFVNSRTGAPFLTDDPATATAGDQTRVTVRSSPALTVQKTFTDANGAPVEPGDQVTYTINVFNSGTATARNVAINDTLDGNLDVVSIGNGGTQAGSTVSWNVTAIVPSPIPTPVTLVVRPRNTVASGTVVSNQARVTAQGVAVAVLSDDPNTAATLDPTLFTVTSVPRLAVSKSLPAGAPRVVFPLDTVTYSIAVTNVGSATATQASLRDELPLGVTFVSASDGGVFDGPTRTVRWNLPDVTPFGGLATRTIVVTVDDTVADGAVLSNQAFGNARDATEAPSDDPSTATALDPTVVTVRAVVDLTTFTKSATDENGGFLLPGDVVLYRVALQNTGTTAARNVTITDLLDANLEVVEVGNGGIASGNSITWSAPGTPALNRLRPADGVIAVTVRARVKAATADATVIPNQATVRSIEVPAGIQSDDTATPAARDATVVRVSAPRLVFLKRVVDLNGPPAIPNDLIRYTVSVENQGSAPSLAVTVDDELPAELQDITLGQGGQLSGRNAQWSPTSTPALSAVQPATRVELTVDARVNPLVDGSAVLTNRASLRQGTLDPVLSDDPATPAPDATVLRLSARPDFAGSSIVIDGSPTVVRPLDLIRFTITVTNSGASVANGVSIGAVVDALVANPVVEDRGTLTGSSAAWDASTVTELGVLRPGQTVVVHLRGNVRSPAPDGARISQRARVRALNLAETILGPAEVVISSKPRFTASSLEVADVNSGEVEPGDLLNYRLTVLNDGSAVGRNVNVTLPIPGGTQYVAGSTRVGGTPRPDVSANSALSGQLSLGDMEPSASVVSTFQVRVLTTVARGYRVSGQALITSDASDTVPSDDPRTPEIIGDSTDVVVGGGAMVVAVLTADPPVTLSDGNTTLRLVLENAGSLPAADLLVTIPAPAGAAFVGGSLTLRGMPQSDNVDGDESALTGNSWVVRVPLLESGQAAVATLRARLAVGSNRADFQGTLARPGADTISTDGDPTRPGQQPTVVSRTGGLPDLGGSTITLTDVNGSTLMAGEEVLVTVQLENRGASAATLNSVNGFGAIITPVAINASSVVNPSVFELRGNAVALKAGVTPPVIAAGEHLTLQFRGTVDAAARTGTEVRTTAIVRLDDNREFNVGPATLLIGSVPGTSIIRGTVFEDHGSRNRRYDAAQDKALPGYQVLLVPVEGGPRATPVLTAVSDEQGAYELPGVAPAEYRIQVRSRGGAHFAEYRVAGLNAGERRTENLRVDPSGVIYDARNGNALAGVQATLYADNGDDDPTNDVVVADRDLPPGQQNQVTGPDGRYRFDPFPGRYRVGLSGPSPTSVWPSSLIPVANDDNSRNPLGSFARTDGDGNVVGDEEPNLNGQVKYYLRFDLPSADKPVLRNHIPVDPLLSHVRLLKTSNKRVANVGDIVMYSVRITNDAAQDFTIDRMGGIEMVDVIPPGFSYIKDSARVDRVTRDSQGRVRREELRTANPNGYKLMQFGPLDLFAKTELEIRYQLAVGPSVRFGKNVNRAIARTAAGQVPVSNEGEATVEVRPETIFDDGTVVGKVFCDQNRDGWQDPNEEGVFAVRVVLDNGFYAETDEHGRFHFTTVGPGTHLAKIDENTLPPGGDLTTLLRQTFYVTRGLPSRISFGVHCLRSEPSNPEVTLNKEGYQPAYVPPPPVAATPDQLHVHGVVTQRLASLNGVRQASIRTDLGVAFGNQDPIIGQGEGPNLMSFDDVNGPSMALSFHPRVETALPLAGTRLVVEDEDSHEVVYLLETDDTPPALLEWGGVDDATGTQKLKSGHRYIATLAAVATNGDVGISAPRRFGIRVGAEQDQPGYETFVDESAGPLFGKKQKANARLMAWLREEAPKLGNIAKAHVDIEVHGDDQASEKDVADNMRRAELLKTQLVTLGFAPSLVDARGLGGDFPRMPNMGKAQRSKNRRVVLRSRTAKALGPPLAPVETVARVNVNGRDVPLRADGVTFETDIPAFVGDLIRVDLTMARGQRVTMTRLYTGQPFAEGAPPPPGSVGVDVNGDILQAAVRVGESVVAAAPSESYGVSLVDGPSPFVLDEHGVPDREVAFAMRAPADAVKWALRVVSDEAAPVDAPDAGPAPSPTDDTDGGMTPDAGVSPIFTGKDVLVYEQTGDGAPPETFRWAGQNAQGNPILKPGVLRYRLVLDLPGGAQVMTPDAFLLITNKTTPVTLSNAFSKDGKRLSMAARMALGGILEQYARSGGTIAVTAHTDNGKPRMKALFETQEQADKVKEALVQSGVPEANVSAMGKGFQEPLVPGTSARARARNRRVELAMMPGGEAVALGLKKTVEPAVEVNGQQVPLVGTSFQTRAFLSRRGDVVIAWRLPSGERVVVKHHPEVPATTESPATLVSVLGPRPTTTLVPLPPGFVMPAPAPAVDADGGTAEFSTWNPAAPVATYWAPGGFGLAFTGLPPNAQDGGVPGDAGPPRNYLPNPSETLAAKLLVDMPPEGSRLGVDRVLVRGVTDPLNQVSVNGQPAVVDPSSGQFIAVVRLSEGVNSVKVETEDVRGNHGAITRTLNVDTTGFFLMGFADTATAVGARLDEFNNNNSISPVIGTNGFALRGGPVTFYGRGVLYARGKMKGFWRIPFVEGTLHIDTARYEDPTFERDLMQAFNYYPTFGDKGVEFQEARARYPVYLRVKGGANELLVGNTTAQLSNGDLFRYGRARYSGVATVDQGYIKLPTNLPVIGGADVGHTRLKLFVAGGDTPRRPAHVEMRGTGGSIYFLKDRDIVEGSERVYVVMRDGITGQELSRVQKVRGQDYNMRYVEGRVFLTVPLNSTGESTYITNQNPTVVTSGNPVYLVVDYEHMGSGDFSEFGAGVAGEQVVLDHFALGGGYVLEGRRNAAPSYQLGGVHARAFYDQDNYVQGEWAYSRAVNVESAISNDGGLSYQPLGQSVNAGAVIQNNTLYPSERSGHAFKLKGQVALGKLLGKAPTDVAGRAYFQRVQGGFFADGSLFEQGQWKYGAEGFYQVTRKDSMRLRWDGMWAEVPLMPQLTEFRRVHREMGIFQLKHVEGPFTFTGEYSSSYLEDSAQFGRVNMSDWRKRWGNTVAAQIDLRATQDVILFARQEGMLTADEQLMPHWNDRLTTSVGARVKLLENLELNVTESLRWNGDNATAVGLRSRVADNTDIYASERITYRNGDLMSTSVVGAGGNTTQASRAYGEYQLDTGTVFTQSRAVMGVSHQWKLMEGFTFAMGYERTQVLGTSSSATGLGPPTAASNGQPMPNAFGDSYAFAQPGANGAAPMFMGTGSRDSMYAQVGFNYFKWLKLQSRFELRQDVADARRGGFSRLMFTTVNSLTWNWTEDLSFIGRFNLMDVQNQTLNVKEAQLQEFVAGLAYRPVKHEWFSVLALLRHRLELRPIMLTEGRFERTAADVASIEPILELPWGFQVVEKLALKWSRDQTDDLKEGNAFTALWITRFNYHAFRMLKKFVPWFHKWPGDIDLAVEYRLRTLLTQSQFDHGVVTEVGIVPLPYVRIGVGFNFSRVSEDEFAKANQNAFGPYVRMQAQY